MGLAVVIGVADGERDAEAREWDLEAIEQRRTVLRAQGVDLSLDLASETNEDLGDITYEFVESLLAHFSTTQLAAERPHLAAHLAAVGPEAILLPVDIEQVIDAAEEGFEIASTMRLAEILDELENLDFDPDTDEAYTVSVLQEATDASVSQRIPVFISG